MRQFYAVSLAVLIIASTPKWAKVFTRHLNIVLLTFCGVFAYRDIYPFATFNSVPADKAEGPILWAKLGVLFFVAIAIPLAIPRLYIPVDPKVCFCCHRKPHRLTCTGSYAKTQP